MAGAMMSREWEMEGRATKDWTFIRDASSSWYPIKSLINKDPLSCLFRDSASRLSAHDDDDDDDDDNDDSSPDQILT